MWFRLYKPPHLIQLHSLLFILFRNRVYFQKTTIKIGRIWVKNTTKLSQLFQKCFCFWGHSAPRPPDQGLFPWTPPPDSLLLPKADTSITNLVMTPQLKILDPPLVGLSRLVNLTSPLSFDKAPGMGSRTFLLQNLTLIVPYCKRCCKVRFAVTISQNWWITRLSRKFKKKLLKKWQMSKKTKKVSSCFDGNLYLQVTGKMADEQIIIRSVSVLTVN